MKKIVAFIMAVAMSLALVACGGESASDMEAIKAKGEMVIGYTVYEPMNYTDENGIFTGFDTELAIAVCKKLGVTPKFVEINWDTKEVELNAGSIDCDHVRIPLKMHLGSPDEPVVRVGMKVNKGEPTAKAKGMGAHIHASISGEVVQVTDAFIEIRG